MKQMSRCKETSAVMSPPKVSLVFRVGVVGHRPNRLRHADLNALASKLRDLLSAVQGELNEYHKSRSSWYSETAPVVRAISPLAEGTDRIFAEQALANACDLEVVLPFPQQEFERDFQLPDALEHDSLGQFRGLLSNASTVFEMDGTRADSSLAYHAAGQVVLNQSDILVVVWDGERKNLRGGTEETFDEAVERGVPIVWIDAYAPHHWRLVTQPLHSLEGLNQHLRAAITKSHTVADLRRKVRQLIELPEISTFVKSQNADHSKSQRFGADVAIRLFYSESQSGLSFAFWWKLFQEFVGDCRIRCPSIRVPYCEDAVKSHWPDDCRTPVASMINELRPYYAWPDKLAEQYADRYRSAFVIAFLAAAFAVAMALAPFALSLSEHGPGEILFTVGELLSILLILFLVFSGRKGRWHQRWLDYRLLAEIIRHQRLIAHLGGERASPQAPEHLSSYGDAGASWMAWYARGVERSLSLPRAVVDKSYLRASLEDLEEQLGGSHGQIEFHTTTAARASRIEHRLHLLEVMLLALTLTCCIQHLMQSFWPSWFHVPGQLLTFCCGFFPAAGAALAGISNQAEFRRITQRSSSMAERLAYQLEKVKQLKLQLESTSSVHQQLSSEIASVVSETARSMVNEVLDWRVIFQDRPLKTT